MMAKSERIALRADPNDPEDFDVTEGALETARDERAKRQRGRPVGSTTSDREQVSLRIPGPVLAHFRAGGAGWQTRIVEVLERAAAKSPGAVGTKKFSDFGPVPSKVVPGSVGNKRITSTAVGATDKAGGKSTRVTKSGIGAKGFNR